MKSSILLLLTALFCLTITMTSCDKEESPIIEEPGETDEIINFTDANFKATLLNDHIIDANNDQEISKSEANAYLGVILAPNKSIENVDGLEHFILLQRLTLNDNNISSIDLSNNPRITYLALGANKLTSIDVSMLEELKEFECHTNNLNSANIANGNNANMSRMTISANPELTCIQVDNAKADRPRFWYKDAVATYSNDCN